MIYLKFAGAACIIAAGTFAGLCAARELGGRVTLIDAMISALRYMRAEMTQKLSALPDIISALAQSEDMYISRFYGYIDVKFSLIDCPGLSTIWTQACEACIPERKLRAVLADLAGTLGRYDAEESERTLGYALERLEKLKDSAQAVYIQKAGLLRRLGVAAGVALAVALL